MKITANLTDAAAIRELGSRLANRRLLLDLTQAALAEQAGVDRKSVVRLENGDAVRLEVLIRILRALELLDGLNRLVPERQPSPIELLEHEGRRRRRASGTRRRAPGTTEPGGFRWGDEPDES